MKIEMHGPMGRTGVSQLMYVGDDGLPPDARTDLPLWVAGVAAAGYVAGTSKGLMRLAAIGAGILAYRRIRYPSGV